MVHMITTLLSTHPPPHRFVVLSKLRIKPLDQHTLTKASIVVPSQYAMLTCLFLSRTDDCEPIILHEATVFAGRPSATRSLRGVSHCPWLAESLADEVTRSLDENGLPNIWSYTHSTHLSVPYDSQTHIFLYCLNQYAFVMDRDCVLCAVFFLFLGPFTNEMWKSNIRFVMYVCPISMKNLVFGILYLGFFFATTCPYVPILVEIWQK